jgi:CBS domain-containing protein
MVMLDEAVVVAGDLMTRDVAVVHPETSLLEAVKLMAKRRISGMPVVDDAGAIVGVLSEGDLVRWHEGYTEKQAHWLDMLADGFQLAPSFLEGVRAERHKVKAVMSPGCVSVSETTLARDIATLMHTKGIKRVPVLRDGKLVGIVARSDLIRALALKLDEKSATPAVEFETVDEALRRRREELGIQPGGATRKAAPAPQATPKT